MIKKIIVTFILFFLNTIVYGQKETSLTQNSQSQLNILKQSLTQKKTSFLQNIRNTIITETDTIKVQRISREERDKLFEIGMNLYPSTQSLLLSVLDLEDFLNKSQESPQGGSSKLDILLKEVTINANKCNLYIDTENYKNEGLYFINHPLKNDRKKTLKEIFREIDLENEKRNFNDSVKRRNDSVLAIEIRYKEVKDSIEFSKQKTIEEIKNKERQNQEVKIKKAQKKQAIVNQTKIKLENEKKRIQRKEDIINKYGLENGQAILNHKVKIGWTKAMCIASWGKPYDINRTTNAYGTEEQYVYSLKKYLYFENGILTAIQD